MCDWRECITGVDNDLVSNRRQVIIWTNNVFETTHIFSIFHVVSVNIVAYDVLVLRHQQAQYPIPPDSKIHGANMGPTWGRQDPGGPHVGHTNLAIWAVIQELFHKTMLLLIQSNTLKIYNVLWQKVFSCHNGPHCLHKGQLTIPIQARVSSPKAHNLAGAHIVFPLVGGVQCFASPE